MMKGVRVNIKLINKLKIIFELNNKDKKTFFQQLQ